MHELEKFSKKLHKEATKQINKISINKVNVIGKHILETYKKINKRNKGKILKNDSDLTNLIFMNRHGYYHDAVCNIRYCPPK